VKVSVVQMVENSLQMPLHSYSSGQGRFWSLPGAPAGIEWGDSVEFKKNTRRKK